MTPVCKICSPFFIPRTISDELAAAERVDNVRVMPISDPFKSRAAVERMKLWENGRTLRVWFVDGNPDVISKVRAIASEWEALANLRLEYVDRPPAEIRISFADVGYSWSTVGTDALGVPEPEPTMNYGWLEPNTDIEEYRRVVRHEFGHALGMIHEHQSPAAQGAIPWDKPKVYAYYSRQGWTREDVDWNIFMAYDAEVTNHSAFDRNSIMQYAIPDELTIGTFSVGWNTRFSLIDAEFMRKQYPKAVAPDIPELMINGPRVDADLAVAGEVDTYRFTVGNPVTAIITTQGAIDTVMALHGPNDRGAILAWDDDLGRLTNARIVRKLQSGQYWVTVRHKHPAAVGAYSVGITSRKAAG
jgi:hypothetical protein